MSDINKKSEEEQAEVFAAAATEADGEVQISAASAVESIQPEENDAVPQAQQKKKIKMPESIKKLFVKGISSAELRNYESVEPTDRKSVV